MHLHVRDVAEPTLKPFVPDKLPPPDDTPLFPKLEVFSIGRQGTEGGYVTVEIIGLRPLFQYRFIMPGVQRMNILGVSVGRRSPDGPLDDTEFLWDHLRRCLVVEVSSGIDSIWTGMRGMCEGGLEISWTTLILHLDDDVDDFPPALPSLKDVTLVVQTVEEELGVSWQGRLEAVVGLVVDLVPCTRASIIRFVVPSSLRDEADFIEQLAGSLAMGCREAVVTYV